MYKLVLISVFKIFCKFEIIHKDLCCANIELNFDCRFIVSKCIKKVFLNSCKAAS